MVEVSVAVLIASCYWLGINLIHCWQTDIKDQNLDTWLSCSWQLNSTVNISSFWRTVFITLVKRNTIFTLIWFSRWNSGKFATLTVTRNLVRGNHSPVQHTSCTGLSAFPPGYSVCSESAWEQWSLYLHRQRWNRMWEKKRLNAACLFSSTLNLT